MFGTSTGWVGAMSSSGSAGDLSLEDEGAGTGTGTDCLGSISLEEAGAPEPDLVEPTGEAAREVMGRA